MPLQACSVLRRPSPATVAAAPVAAPRPPPVRAAWSRRRPRAEVPDRLQRAALARDRCRVVAAPACSAAAAAPTVDVETTRRLLNSAHVVLDVRPTKQFDDSRITKPPRRSANVPYAAGGDGAAFVAAVSRQFSPAGSKLVVMCADGGADSAEAAALLVAAGWADVAQVQGGYIAYCEVWGPSGKRRPPAGRWVSTGKEALKSGLNIPGVADAYDEGGNAKTARYAKGLDEGQELLEGGSWLAGGGGGVAARPEQQRTQRA